MHGLHTTMCDVVNGDNKRAPVVRDCREMAAGSDVGSYVAVASVVLQPAGLSWRVTSQVVVRHDGRTTILHHVSIVSANSRRQPLVLTGLCRCWTDHEQRRPATGWLHRLLNTFAHGNGRDLPNDDETRQPQTMWHDATAVVLHWPEFHHVFGYYRRCIMVTNRKRWRLNENTKTMEYYIISQTDFIHKTGGLVS